MKIGFIGLGNVGGKLAANLQNNGFGHRYGVPMELAPVTLDVIKDGLDRYGPRVWSSMVVKRKEDDCCIDFRAKCFPDCLEDDQPAREGQEVKVRGRDC